MKALKIEFNEKLHQYKVNGDIKLSVTQVCGLLKSFSHIPKEILERAGQRGQAVHTLSELLDLKKLIGSRLTKELLVGMPYLEGYRLLKKEHPDLKIVAVEKQVYCASKGYIGRLDRVCQRKKVGIVGDVKSNARPSWTWAVQLSAYKRAWNEMGLMPRIDERMVFHLNKHAGYNIIYDHDMLPDDVCLELFDICHEKLKNDRAFDAYLIDFKKQHNIEEN